MLCCTNCYVIDKFQIVTAEFPGARCARIVRSPIGSFAIETGNQPYVWTRENLVMTLPNAYPTVCPSVHSPRQARGETLGGGKAKPV